MVIPEFEYFLKVVNPSKMSEFVNLRLGTWKQCETLSALRCLLEEKTCLPSEVKINKPNFQIVEIGYIEPGHGLRGQKVWLYADADLKGMYDKLTGKKSIQLWCYTHVTATKSQKETSKDLSASSESQKSDVDAVYEQLREKHSSYYDEERLRMWAHLVQMGKHTSLDEPPDKPYFRGCKRPNNEQGASGCTKTRVVSSSPGRKVSMRTELIDQLEKWNQLRTSGMIDENEYQELRKTIIIDIKEL